MIYALRATFRHKVLGPHALFVPRSGSNNWAVAPAHTTGGPMLAGDPHLSLPNPSIFYPTHLTIPGQLDVEGSTFQAFPGVLHGHNGNVAWASTVVYHDVNDVYLEDILPCTAGGGDCVAYKGEVKIETWQETINLGSLGTVFDTRTVTYERVPHHGHIIPTIEELVPSFSARATKALSGALHRPSGNARGEVSVAAQSRRTGADSRWTASPGSGRTATVRRDLPSVFTS